MATPEPQGAAARRAPIFHSVNGTAGVAPLTEAALPTRSGAFRAAIYRLREARDETLVLVRGRPGFGGPPLVRLHSECLTGDALGSLRCDCGEQLHAAMSMIDALGEGAVLYLRQEGRGIGLANKIRAYALQDRGLDTVDANTALGLPVDGREYASAATVLRSMNLTRIRLLTNNPAKAAALEEHGIRVVERVPLVIPPNEVNLGYLRTKVRRMGHLIALDPRPECADLGESREAEPEGTPSPRALRLPYVTVHYAQTLDGRIATRTGNSQWISGDASLRLAHQLRATHQAIMVGVGTVMADNPRLTVRHVAGSSPRRVVVDSTLRLPLDSNVVADGEAPTTVATTPRAERERLAAMRAAGVDVLVIPERDRRVSMPDLLRALAAMGMSSVLVEGGAALITSVLRESLVNRLVVCIAPKVVGAGIEAVGNLDILRLSEALTFVGGRFTSLGEDVIFDGELQPSRDAAA